MGSSPVVLSRNTGNTLRSVLGKVGQNYLHKISEQYIVIHCVEGDKMVYNNIFESNAVTDKTPFF